MRNSLVVLFSALFVVRAQYYEVPDALIEALKPKGLRISIPDEAGVELFAIHVNVNKQIYNREAGQINQETRKSKNGRWVIEDPRVRLKKGDTLNYWLYVQVDGLGYPKDDLTYTVNEFVGPTESPPPAPGGGQDNRFQNCLPTQTTVNGRASCEGRLVFEDSFNNFNSSNWKHVIQFAGSPDFEFVAYSNDEKNSYVKDGRLHIKPTLLSDDGIDVMTGSLTLSGCTGLQDFDCSRSRQGVNIVPPVKSAQLRTKESFSFRYGTVELQAKLPRGDWIFPEIWLESKNNGYGTGSFESGRIQIALVRGNQNLVKNNKDLGVRHLEVNCIMAFGQVVHTETFTIDGSGFWSDSFHTYSVTWTPDSISFTVDGREIGKVTPPSGGFSKLATFSELQNVPWGRGSKMAPFDQEFYITIGLGVGGFRVFPEGSVSSNRPKPWKNLSTKGMLQFWQDRDNWFPSWSGDGSSLQVEHVRVWAL